MKVVHPQWLLAVALVPLGALGQQIKAARCVVVLWSQAACDSAWVLEGDRGVT